VSNAWHIHDNVSRTMGTCSVSINTTPMPACADGQSCARVWLRVCVEDGRDKR
jgi:hypothetical protein